MNKTRFDVNMIIACLKHAIRTEQDIAEQHYTALLGSFELGPVLGVLRNHPS
jgi:hypothetical protein